LSTGARGASQGSSFTPFSGLVGLEIFAKALQPLANALLGDSFGLGDLV